MLLTGYTRINKHRYIFTRPGSSWVYDTETAAQNYNEDTASAYESQLLHLLNADNKPSPIKILNALDVINDARGYGHEHVFPVHPRDFRFAKYFTDDDTPFIDGELIFVYSPDYDCKPRHEPPPIVRSNDAPRLFPFVCALRRFRAPYPPWTPRRFVLIDTQTGWVAGDTGQRPDFIHYEQTPINAARLLDDDDRVAYKIVPMSKFNGWGYRVYDVTRLGFLPPIEAGEGQILRDLVETLGRFLCVVQKVDRKSLDDDYDENSPFSL